LLAWFVTFLLALVSLKATAAAYYGLLTLISVLGSGFATITTMVGAVDAEKRTLPFWLGAWAAAFVLTFAINFFFSQAMAFALMAVIDLAKEL